MANRLTATEFEHRANRKHNSRYTYHNDYTCNKDPVSVTCPVHGRTSQTANHHLAGYGCPQCGNSKSGRHTDNTEEFITKAMKTHGDKYDYTNSTYVKGTVKVAIMCKTHGVFKQLPSAHIRGNGCYKCGKKCVSTEEFVTKAVGTHGDRYDYRKVDYRTNRVKVSIGCSIHGEFMQTPSNHLSGSGCPECGIHHRPRKVLSMDKFIASARALHPDRYSYENVIYVTAMTKVSITCKHHGEFLQSPNSHMAGSGCPKCRYKRKR